MAASMQSLRPDLASSSGRGAGAAAAAAGPERLARCVPRCRRSQARSLLAAAAAATSASVAASTTTTAAPASTSASASSSAHSSRRRRRGVIARGALSDTPVKSFADEPTSTTNRQQQQQQAQAGGAQGSGRGGSVGTDRVGVLLLNLGGPDTLDDVQPFLYNLFADPDIIRLPGLLKVLQPFLAFTLSTLRAPKSAEGYASIGGGSPLRRITQLQADALTDSLRSKGLPANVYVGMRYWHPYTEEALEQIKRDNVGRLVILPLYPQFSISTSGSSLRLLEKILKEDELLRGLRHTVIPSWYQRAGYVTAMADLITTELDKFEEPQSAELFFSAHGVPKSYVEEAGDPYKEEMEECISLIVSEVKRRGYNNHHTLAYQSRVGPVEWLQPYTDDTIRELGAAGTKSMLAIPISFVSEHIETLEEIDVEYRELAEESGIKNWGRVPALNTNATFIGDLADAVLEALPYVGQLAKPSDALVPQGELEALLQAYDRERRALPSPVVMWQWGWTRSAETWNGRLAMVALFAIVMLELSTGRPILRYLLDLD